MNCTAYAPTSRARFTYENSAIELSILLCISEARETSLIGDVKHTIAELAAAEGRLLSIGELFGRA